MRLPIQTGHSESVYIEVDRDDATVEDIKNLLKEAPGVTLQDDPSQQLYPMPADAVGKTMCLWAASAKTWTEQTVFIYGLFLITY